MLKNQVIIINKHYATNTQNLNVIKNGIRKKSNEKKYIICKKIVTGCQEEASNTIYKQAR